MNLLCFGVALFMSSGCSALQKPLLSAPAATDMRQPILVTCRYADPPPPPPTRPVNDSDQQGERGVSARREVIQSLKLYVVLERIGSVEIFRFTPSEVPQSHRFGGAGGVRAARAGCAGGACDVTLRAPPGELGLRCELSAEGPTFEIVSSAATVDVYAEPVYGPTIVGGPSGGGPVSEGDMLLLNCSTDLAAPVAHVYWTLDGLQLADEAMSPVSHGEPDELGLRKSWRSARVVVPRGDGGVRVACVAAQPPPAGERRAEVAFERVREPQISKYTAASRAASTCAALASLWILLTSQLLDMR